jgi:hypothetical protein
MSVSIRFCALLAFALCFELSYGQEAADDTDTTPAESEATATEPTAGDERVAQTSGGVKTLSGMSILGNEEAPKSLVIVPWKSSELGDGISVNDVIDERARPVDKEVFLREVRYYQLRLLPAAVGYG